MTTKLVVKLSAAIEMLTGAALILTPSVVAILLLGVGGLNGSGIAIARLTGIALLSLVIACWPRDHVTANAVFALLAYNLLAAVYLASLRVAGGFVIGPLLWPACVLHLLFALLLGRAVVRHGLPGGAMD
jgi:hypothetical protein